MSTLKITLPMYDGDSIIRRAMPFIPELPAQAAATPAASLAAAPAASLLEAAGKASRTGPYTDFGPIAQRARRHRALAIAELFARLVDWFARKAESARHRDLENYLSGSTDLADLERRMRMWERRGVPPFGVY